MEGKAQGVAAGLPAAGPVRLALGVGNPGDRYERTRHNAGIWLVRRLAQGRGLSFSAVSDLPAVMAGVADGTRLATSKTYMNESGAAAAGLAHYLGIKPSSLLVAHDDLDIEVGKARYKFGGGTAGHNGLSDISEKLGTRDFWRLRIGIGHPRDLEGDRANMAAERYVLEAPDTAQMTLIEACLDKAVQGWDKVEAQDMDGAIKHLHSEAAEAP